MSDKVDFDHVDYYKAEVINLRVEYYPISMVKNNVGDCLYEIYNSKVRFKYWRNCGTDEDWLVRSVCVISTS